MHELQVMNIQMRIITEDNIEQLTSMNYAKTIENLKLTKLTEKEQLEFSNELVQKNKTFLDSFLKKTSY